MTPAALDETNWRLLAVLQSHGRITAAELAGVLGLSPSAVLDRWRKLEAAGVIRRYRTIVDLDRIASHVRVFAEITLTDRRPETRAAFLSEVRDRPEVVAAYGIDGPFDVLLSLLCRDVRDYHALSEHLIDTAPGLAKVIGHVVLDDTKPFAGMPLAALSGLPLAPAELPPPPAASGPLRLDALHVKILETLQTRGRLSNIALAETVGLSPSPCLERVKRLEAHGLIRRVLADLDLTACVPGCVHAMAEVTLASHYTGDFRRFEARVRAIPEIISAYKIAGSYDYTMDIVCRDATHLQDLEARLAAPEMALGTLRLNRVSSRLKPFAGYPLARLTGDGPRSASSTADALRR